jgi:hypothetical protein
MTENEKDKAEKTQTQILRDVFEGMKGLSRSQIRN